MKGGMTQAQIANACGTGQSHISALRTGARKCPSWQLGEALLKLHKSSKAKNSEEAA